MQLHFIWEDGLQADSLMNGVMSLGSARLNVCCLKVHLGIYAVRMLLETKQESTSWRKSDGMLDRKQSLIGLGLALTVVMD
jgi:hypothetical protein